eukprot:TRINITY_DN12905_c0_g1_i4.p1 TRINITY_DN12905_c0_g1~~TRINITY_DN12905_c0_g1_i4.p1  ORF type:complete len:787 (-),score=187.58 TRINITY_DN12905_c0_g1_i4:92-2452(-)
MSTDVSDESKEKLPETPSTASAPEPTPEQPSPEQPPPDQPPPSPRQSAKAEKPFEPEPAQRGAFSSLRETIWRELQAAAPSTSPEAKQQRRSVADAPATDAGAGRLRQQRRRSLSTAKALEDWATKRREQITRAAERRQQQAQGYLTREHTFQPVVLRRSSPERSSCNVTPPPRTSIAFHSHLPEGSPSSPSSDSPASASSTKVKRLSHSQSVEAGRLNASPRSLTSGRAQAESRRRLTSSTSQLPAASKVMPVSVSIGGHWSPALKPGSQGLAAMAQAAVRRQERKPQSLSAGSLEFQGSTTGELLARDVTFDNGELASDGEREDETASGLVRGCEMRATSAQEEAVHLEEASNVRDFSLGGEAEELSLAMAPDVCVPKREERERRKGSRANRGDVRSRAPSFGHAEIVPLSDRSCSSGSQTQSECPPDERISRALEAALAGRLAAGDRREQRAVESVEERSLQSPPRTFAEKVAAASSPTSGRSAAAQALQATQEQELQAEAHLLVPDDGLACLRQSNVAPSQEGWAAAVAHSAADDVEPPDRYRERRRQELDVELEDLQANLQVLRAASELLAFDDNEGSWAPELAREREEPRQEDEEVLVPPSRLQQRPPSQEAEEEEDEEEWQDLDLLDLTMSRRVVVRPPQDDEALVPPPCRLLGQRSPPHVSGEAGPEISCWIGRDADPPEAGADKEEEDMEGAEVPAAAPAEEAVIVSRFSWEDLAPEHGDVADEEDGVDPPPELEGFGHQDLDLPEASSLKARLKAFKARIGEDSWRLSTPAGPHIS